MIKDIVLHLSADLKHEVAANYAVSVAEAFGAHLAAITFAYDPVLPASLMGGVLPVDFINEQRALAEEAAKAAMAKFDEMGRRIGAILWQKAREREPVVKSASGTDLAVVKGGDVRLKYQAEISPKLTGSPLEQVELLDHRSRKAFEALAWEAADRVNLDRPLEHTKTEQITTKVIVLNCPRCPQQLRVPTDRGVLRVKCPNGHRFLFDPDD